jgi:cellulose biosynthesis protein BcsQ
LLLRRILFTAGRFVVVPCQVDDGSVDGIAGVLETVRDVRDVDGLNPDLEVLGAFLGPVQNGAAKTSRMAREKINDLVGEEDFVFETTIRSAQAISSYCRQEGILSNDYELLAGQVAQRRKRWFKQTAEERLAAKAKHSFSEAAPGLARDWQLLVTEIMLRFGARSDMKQAAQDNA